MEDASLQPTQRRTSDGSRLYDSGRSELESPPWSVHDTVLMLDCRRCWRICTPPGCSVFCGSGCELALVAVGVGVEYGGGGGGCVIISIVVEVTCGGTIIVSDCVQPSDGSEPPRRNDGAGEKTGNESTVSSESGGEPYDMRLSSR